MIFARSATYIVPAGPLCESRLDSDRPRRGFFAGETAVPRHVGIDNSDELSQLPVGRHPTSSGTNDPFDRIRVERRNGEHSCLSDQTRVAGDVLQEVD